MPTDEPDLTDHLEQQEGPWDAAVSRWIRQYPKTIHRDGREINLTCENGPHGVPWVCASINLTWNRDSSLDRVVSTIKRTEELAITEVLKLAKEAIIYEYKRLLASRAESKLD